MRASKFPTTILFSSVAISLSALYVSYLPTQLTWANFGGDGGDFLAAMLSDGIPHPSGYPTYLLLGKAFQALAWSSAYWRAALLSAMCMALAGGLWSVWMYRFLLHPGWQNQIVAALAGLAWGTAPLVWSQAVIVEVHGLQSLLAAAWFWWIGLVLVGHRGKRMLVLALLGGVSIGNHLTIVLFIPALLAAYWLKRNIGSLHFWAGQTGFFFAGLLVYLVLPALARGYPPVNWGNPQTWEGFLWTVSGAPYRGLLFGTPAPDLFNRFSAWAKQIIDQFGLAGLFIGAIGATQPTQQAKALNGVLIWVFAAYSMFAISYDAFDSVVYLIPAFLSASAWVGLGLSALLNWRWRNSPLGVIILVGFALFLLIRAPMTARKVDPRLDNTAAVYAENYMRDAPQRALLLTEGDADSFPLWYEHFGLGTRPDVRVVVVPLTQFDWYRETLFAVYPDLALPGLDEFDGSQWGEAIPGLNIDRPVCRSKSSPGNKPEVTYVCW